MTSLCVTGKVIVLPEQIVASDLVHIISKMAVSVILYRRTLEHSLILPILISYKVENHRVAKLLDGSSYIFSTKIHFYISRGIKMGLAQIQTYFKLNPVEQLPFCSYSFVD